MSDTVPVNFRVLPTERDAWKQQALKEGVSLTELVRRTMNARLGEEAIKTARTIEWPVADHASVPGPSFERPRRTETCEHRLAPETFCRWCDD